MHRFTMDHVKDNLMQELHATSDFVQKHCSFGKYKLNPCQDTFPEDLDTDIDNQLEEYFHPLH